jgi:hypothetical protein
MLTLIFSLFFLTKKHEEVNKVVSKVQFLLSNGFQPVEAEDAIMLIEDFEIPYSIIINYNLGKETKIVIEQ